MSADQQAMTTAGLQAKVSLRQAWFHAHPNQPMPEGRAVVEHLIAVIEAEARAEAGTLAAKIIRDVRAAIHGTGDLDAAWAAAEAAAHAIAPGIGAISVSRWAWNVPEPFVASWRNERAFGPTPAAALHALAEALRGR